MEKISSNGFWRYALTDRSTHLLIISNLITIVFAVIENWDLSTVIFIFVCQTAIIVFFYSIKILYLKNDVFFAMSGPVNDKTAKIGKVLIASIFLVVFYFVLWKYFDFFEFINIFGNFNLFENFSIDLLMIVPIISFFINHFFSFRNYVKKSEYERHNFFTIAKLSIIRILPIHILIFIFGFVLIILNIIPPITFVILFLILKMMADVVSHVYEHNPKLMFKN